MPQFRWRLRAPPPRSDRHWLALAGTAGVLVVLTETLGADDALLAVLRAALALAVAAGGMALLVRAGAGISLVHVPLMLAFAAAVPRLVAHSTVLVPAALAGVVVAGWALGRLIHAQPPTIAAVATAALAPMILWAPGLIPPPDTLAAPITPGHAGRLQVAVLLAAVALVIALRRSAWGRAVVLLQTGDRVVMLAGWNPARLRADVFALTAGMAAIAGGVLGSGPGPGLPLEVDQWQGLALLAVALPALPPALHRSLTRIGP